MSVVTTTSSSLMLVTGSWSAVVTTSGLGVVDDLPMSPDFLTTVLEPGGAKIGLLLTGFLVLFLCLALPLLFLLLLLLLFSSLEEGLRFELLKKKIVKRYINLRLVHPKNITLSTRSCWHF